MRRKRKSKTVAPVLVLFTKAKNDKGEMVPCVYAQCQYGGGESGPIWGQTFKQINRAVSLLSEICECGRPRHKRKYIEGEPTPVKRPD